MCIRDRIFHDSLGEIKTQLFQADKKALLILVIFGNLYVLLDGWVLHYMIVKNREKCTLWQAIRLAYMVVFFNVTTFAAGTKPAQIYDLYQESQIKPGKSFGILTMEYVSHKLTIVLYAAAVSYTHLHCKTLSEPAASERQGKGRCDGGRTENT